MKNLYPIIMRWGFICSMLIVSLIASAQVKETDFRTNVHPRVFVTKDDKQAILEKIETVGWAKDIYESLKVEVDPIIAIHRKNPSYVVSRMQMHWEQKR